MSQLQIFNSEEFGEIRTVTIDNEPWFVGKDVATALGYSNSRKAIIDHVHEDDKGVTKCDTPSGTQNMTIINESGLYALIFGSKLELAQRFKHWVTSEVLPSIRKHGGYISGQESMTDDELLAKALLVAQSKIAERDRLIAEKQKQIEILEPKAEYTDDVLNSKGLFSTNQIAGDFGLSAQELNKKLKELGVQYKQSGQWLLYSKYRGKGYLGSATCTIGKENKYSKMYSKWTQKGRMFIYELLKKEGIYPIPKREKEYLNQ